MQPTMPSADIGVIVGRFQVPELHEGHIELIESVRSRHQHVLIFLGINPGVLVTRKNPLDFASRKAMIQQRYPEIVVLPITDEPTDEGWSATLDAKIREITDPNSVLLYGSRDGFVPAYKGRYPVIELAATKHISGEQIRASVNNTVRASEDFRRGVIYAAFHRHPTSYQTVDCALVRTTSDCRTQLCVGRKRTDPSNLFRFFGGFVSPKDATLESAAARELAEETCSVSVHFPPKFIGSARISDFRYAKEEDKILTAFFLFTYFSGAPRPGDDIDQIEWFDINPSLTEEHFVESHRGLFRMLTAYLQGS